MKRYLFFIYLIFLMAFSVDLVFAGDNQYYSGRNNVTGNFYIQGDDIEVSIFPNPLIDEDLTLQANKDFVEVEILNVVGKTIYRKKFEEGIRKVVIDFNEFDKGLFIVRIKFNNNNLYTEKLVVR